MLNSKRIDDLILKCLSDGKPRSTEEIYRHLQERCYRALMRKMQRRSVVAGFMFARGFNRITESSVRSALSRLYAQQQIMPKDCVASNPWVLTIYGKGHKRKHSDVHYIDPLLSAA